MRASHCPWKGFLAQQVYEALTKDSAKAPPAPLESAATIVDLAADERKTLECDLGRAPSHLRS